MGTSSNFIDRIGADLQRAYSIHAARRHKRRLVVGIVVLVLGSTATASAVTGVFDGFSIAQDQHANIVGSPPQHIACGAAGCVRNDQATKPSDGRWLYEFSHRVGDDLPTSGEISEGLIVQGVYSNGKELSPPVGADLSYACTTIDGSNLDCTPENRVGKLPRGTAIYVLSASEYPGYIGPS